MGGRSVIQQLRHSTAAGGWSVNVWDYDHLDATVFAVIQLAAGTPLYLNMHVRGARQPNARGDRLIIWPLDASGERWEIESACFDAWVAHPAVRPERLHLEAPTDRTVRFFPLLTHTPERVAEKIQEAIA